METEFELNSMQQVMAETDARNIILVAPTGSGKTLAFAMRLLRNLDCERRGLQALVIAPTRELVIQIESVLRPLTRPMLTVSLYGGHRFSDEVNSLAANPAVVVATPGRLLDHLGRGNIDISGVKSLVIDEYDKTLELGFIGELTRIIKRIKHPSLRILTSATKPEELPDILAGVGFSYLNFDIPTYRGVKPEESPRAINKTSNTQSNEPQAGVNIAKTIIFVNFRENADKLYTELHRKGVPVGVYHGGMRQDERRLAVELFANGTTPVLIATDLAARGLDIPQVAQVIHYDRPLTDEVRIHREGRGSGSGLWADSVEDLMKLNLPKWSKYASIVLNGGRREKISKGDIVGFLVKTAGLEASEIGIISVDDHRAVVAVDADRADRAMEALRTAPLKGRRLRPTLIL